MFMYASLLLCVMLDCCVVDLSIIIEGVLQCWETPQVGHTCCMIIVLLCMYVKVG